MWKVDFFRKKCLKSMTALLTFIMLQNCVKCWWSFLFALSLKSCHWKQEIVRFNKSFYEVKHENYRLIFLK